jgi:hypothetical protein
MKILKLSFLTLAATLLLLCVPATSHAQVSVGVAVGGPAPVCPYGYYAFPPYDCAPYGYYGPEWFTGGLFIGAGPWFHGPQGWHGGYVNRSYDPHYGYHGAYPQRNEAPRQGWNGHPQGFQGNAMHDGHNYREGGGHDGH